jgi:hypothetical protein
MVFGGLITIMLLGFLLDQIPDPAFAEIMEVDPNDEAEKGQANGGSESERNKQDVHATDQLNISLKVGSRS